MGRRSEILASVLVLLAVVGVALVALGAFVVLQDLGRSGGTLHIWGIVVNSVTAGLPLIVLGVLVVVVTVQRQSSDRSGTPSYQAPGRTLTIYSSLPPQGDSPPQSVSVNNGETLALEKAGNKAGKYIGICGQGPSDHPDFAAWLMNEGIESMSLNPDSVIDTWQRLAALKK